MNSTLSASQPDQNYIYYDIPARTKIVPHSLAVNCSGGLAALMGNDIVFVDRWSSTATWGNNYLPAEGDSILVPKGQTLLVDVSPPVLKLVLIEGTMIFEDKDINFDSHYILVRNGEIRAGTRDSPFVNKLTITLHGKKQDNALPGMGNKFIGIVNGTLKFYGSPREPTWTELS